MTVREEILTGLSDLGATKVEIDKDREVHGRGVTHYAVHFDTPKGPVVAEWELANDLKVGASDIVRIMRSSAVHDLEDFQ